MKVKMFIVIFMVLFAISLIILLIYFWIVTERHFGEMNKIEKQKIDIVLNALEELWKNETI